MVFRTFLTFGAASALDLVLLPEKYADKGGRCLTGTMSGYYYAAPPSGESDLWVIKMDGGGACASEQTCKKWAAKDNGKAGSSENWAKTKSPNRKAAILSDDPSINPDFYGAHKVQIPYCSGDGHQGQAVEPQWGSYYFSGHLNFQFMLHNMEQTIPAFKQAKRVLLHGNSAGGIGTMANCDYLQDKLTHMNVSATVSCAPLAGWFVPGFTEDHDDPEMGPTPWAQWSVGQTGEGSGELVELYQSYLHPDCVKAHSSQDAYKCSSASVVYPYIKAPMFVMQNQYDPAQLNGELGLPHSGVTDKHGQEYIAYFGRAMRNSTNQVLAKSSDGLFLPSCFDHGDGLGVGPILGTTKLKGFTGGQALADWFFGRGKVPAILVDDCEMVAPGLPCNPTCEHLPSGESAVV